MPDSQEVTIQIHCHNLPGNAFEGRTGVRLGIQKGSEVIEDVPGDISDVVFTVPLRVDLNAQTGQPNFLGPFAQGTPNERFIYLSWGERKQDGWDMFRRAKLHLKYLSYETVKQALNSREPIKVAVNMTDDKGGPLCASIKGDKLQWQL